MNEATDIQTKKKQGDCSRSATGYPTPPYIAAMLTALIFAPFVGVFLALVELFCAPVRWLKWADTEARKSDNA